jgi:hypothetical protein
MATKNTKNILVPFVNVPRSYRRLESFTRGWILVFFVAIPALDLSTRALEKPEVTAAPV